MKWMFLTRTRNLHSRNIIRSLIENGSLGVWYGGWPHAFKTEKPGIIALRMLGLGSFSDPYTQKSLPYWFYSHNWWEIARMAGTRLGLRPEWVDHLWEKGEHALDDFGSRVLRSKFDGVIGVEHGCLRSLQEASKLKKKSALIYMSLHHSFRQKWVDPEYLKYPGWAESSEPHLLRLAALRDERRDAEARIAGQIYSNSNLTRQSLMDGGFHKKVIHSVPLGLPSPEPEREKASAGKLNVTYVGAVALHKGFQYLHEAFRHLPKNSATLHVYGSIRVRKSALTGSDNIIYHGSKDHNILRQAYQDADVVVFPSLSDGFGLVVGEAFSFGTPVICSENAGAVEFVQNGKNGFRIPPANAMAIQECLERCLDERTKLLEMRAEARRTCLSWSWEHFRKEWFERLKG